MVARLSKKVIFCNSFTLLRRDINKYVGRGKYVLLNYNKQTFRVKKLLDDSNKYSEIGIKSFSSWKAQYLKKFVERGHTKYPGSNYIIRPDGKKKKITDETKEQLLELFKIIEDPDVMMAVVFGTFCGLRISEVCKLRKEDIDYDRMLIKILNSKLPGKTLAGYGKDRTVPIPSKIIHLVKMWSEQKQGQYFFESINKANQPITTYHLFRKYRRSLKKAGLVNIDHQNKTGKQISRYNFHTLRHTYATMLWEKTGDIYAVKQALGHNDLDTTMIYTHITDKALQQKVNSAFEIGMPIRRYEQEQPMQMMKREPLKIESENPLEVLRLRLAKGEIDVDKFSILKKELRGDMNYFG